MIELSSKTVQRTFKEIGPFKIKQSDIPKTQFKLPLTMSDHIIREDTGEVYYGEWSEKDSAPHGRGILISSAEDFYEGFFNRGKTLANKYF